MRPSMKTFVVIVAWAFAALGNQVQARELAGVEVREGLGMDDGTTLVLNGAGVRAKFIFDIYVAALYLAEPEADPQKVIADDGRKRLEMHFVYDEVSREKLVDAFNDGFTANAGKARLAALQERIDAFNALFTSARKGDVIVLDYRPGMGTNVIVNDQLKGTVAGKDFNDALLRIWLGDEPVTSTLKKKLLGG